MTEERDEDEDTWSPGQIHEPRPEVDEAEQVPTLEWIGIDEASKAEATWKAPRRSHGSHHHRRRPRTQTVAFVVASSVIMAVAAVVIVG
jgi:hypothetical protein